MKVVRLIPELRDDMSSLPLAPEFARSRVDASQTEMTTLLASFLTVTLHLATLASIACLGGSLVS